MRWPLRSFLAWYLWSGLLLAQAPRDPLARFRETSRQWEPDIQQLEQRDQTEVADGETILFLGSSSIRRWESLPLDLPQYKTLRRAYGGAAFSDLAVFVERLIARHQPRAIVIFVANDIRGDAQTDLPPEQVVALASYSLQRIRRKFDTLPVFFIAITPTPSRFSAWCSIQRVNLGLCELTCRDPNCHFIATADHFLDCQGRPRVELFLSDQLHLNQAGYQIWAQLLAEAFQQVLHAP